MCPLHTKVILQQLSLGTRPLPESAAISPETERGEPVRPFMPLIGSTLTDLSPSYFMRLPTLVPQPVTIWLPLVSKI